MRLIDLDAIMAQFPKADFYGDAIENMKAYPYWKTDITGLINILEAVPIIEQSEDCISREALYEALSEWDEQDAYLPYHFKELVAELPSVIPEAKWIPVSEKLPEPLTAVLLTVRYKSTGILTYQMGYWEDACERWEKWIEVGTLEDKFEILAWMELPEIYEEDNHE